jgi:hypothetical protein
MCRHYKVQFVDVTVKQQLVINNLLRPKCKLINAEVCGTYNIPLCYEDLHYGIHHWLSVTFLQRT